MKLKSVAGNIWKVNNILAVISEKLWDVGFAFIGSANLYIQGLEVEPRDIDILTTPEGIKQIDKILGEFRTKEIYFDKSEGRNSFRSFYEIDNMEIEVLGNVNSTCRNLESLQKKKYVKFGKIELPCVSLIDELDAYRKMGRMEKVKIIQRFLRAQE